MFSITKKVLLAASFLAIYSGQFVAFASKNDNHVYGAEIALKRIAFAQPTQVAVVANLAPTPNVYQQAILVKDIIRMIAEHAAYQCLLDNDNKGLSALARVCKDLRMHLKTQIGTLDTLSLIHI